MATTTSTGSNSIWRARRRAEPGSFWAQPIFLNPRNHLQISGLWALPGTSPRGGLLISLAKSLLTADATRRRAMGQILLLAAGFSVLVAISVASVILVNRARDDNRWVVHTVEVENQINTVLLEIRRAESGARGYLLTLGPEFLADHEAAVAAVIPDVDRLGQLTSDNPAQSANMAKLRPAIQQRLSQFAQEMDFIKRGEQAKATDLVRQAAASNATGSIRDAATAMLAEEGRLFAQRTEKADRTQVLASSVTIAGSSCVIALAALSIFLVRRSARARDAAEAQLRDNNLDLESTVQERTSDLREANEEIQRFAYIVSHDLRSPLVNIMGFTSELEELRGDIFKRIATLGREASATLVPENATDDAEPVLDGPDQQLSQDFAEALGFIKSSIAKMDRLISAILNLTREGRREFQPEPIDTRELIEGIVSTVAHQAAEASAQIRIEPLPDIVSDRLALEQIFSNLIDNALKYLKPGVPGDITVRGRTKLGFAIFEIADNGRGIDPKDHQRIFDLFRRAGTQDRPGQGIGLAHVRALVRRLGGTMSVASELHQGSTFTITLPATWSATSRNREA
jgi:signal transduction histidine kinase